MKARRYICWFICVAALLLVGYAGLAPGIAPGAAPETLGRALGPLSLLPPLLAVALAFLLKDVVLSLLIGYVAGTALLAAVNGGGLWAVTARTFSDGCSGILTTVTDPEKAEVLVLCIVIGGMVEVIRKSSGFEVLAQRLTRRINSPRKACLVGELMGLGVFFDDYANALIVGPVLQPVTDKLGISREKLAYLVDSTAAPVTGIAIISSWVAVEVSVIDEGLALAGMDLSGYGMFLGSIPYCFYCIFCLLFIFQSSLMEREFGPMLKAENRARSGMPLRPGAKVERPPQTGAGARLDKQGGRMLVALGSILLLIVMAVITFYTDGRAAAIALGELEPDAPFSLATLATAFGQANTIYLVMQAAMAGSIAALALGCALKLFTFREGLETWIRGASSMMVTVFILVLAWALASTVTQLGTVYFVVDIISASVPWWIVPTMIFLACCLISFATGSYGCMFIVMPMAIPIATAVTGLGHVPDPDAFLLVCIASVLSGGIFGDHSSPITDCTILSSLGSGCETMDHVQTQMPYAFTVAAVSVLCGTLLSALGVPAWACLLLGGCALALCLILFGKVPQGTRNTTK